MSVLFPIFYIVWCDQSVWHLWQGHHEGKEGVYWDSGYFEFVVIGHFYRKIKTKIKWNMGIMLIRHLVNIHMFTRIFQFFPYQQPPQQLSDTAIDSIHQL